MGGNSGRKVIPARSRSRRGKRRATTFRYAEYDGDLYRWPTEMVEDPDEDADETGMIEIDDMWEMERWYGDAWGPVAHGTDLRTKVSFYGAKYTPEAVVKETGTKDSIA